MVEGRWLLRLLPPVVGAGAVTIGLAASIGAAEGSWEPAACAGGTAGIAAAARSAAPEDPADVADEAWFTLDAAVDDRGELGGQRLRIGVGAARGRFVELPAESSAAGPFGRLVLVSADDGRRSQVRAVDAAAQCWWTLDTTTDVVRGVTFDPVGAVLYEHRVDRRTREDLGVWRQTIDGAGASRAMAAPVADAEIGPTFVTTLGWTLEGDRLVVQSCGAAVCRTRLLDPVTGNASAVPGEHGELIGVAAGQAMAYEPCVGLPCAVVSIDVATGDRVPLGSSARLAVLAVSSAGPRVVLEAGAEAGHLEVRRLDGSLERTIAGAAGLALMPSGDRAAAGTRTPPGWVVAAPDGRSPDGAILVRLADGATAGVAEVTR